MAQLTLDQLRAFGITPDRSLGQHFLVDDNVLDVIARLARLGADDVVYEPGPGVGVLTDKLAGVATHVHAIEIDKRLQPALEFVAQQHSNVTVVWADAMAVQPGALDPVPDKLISNLPYNVAAPIVAEALQHAPTIRTYCVMVQKEVGDRFFAAPGGKQYGGVSVLVQALCEKTGTHRVSRAVFIPRPNVDSMLVAFTRRDDPGIPDEQVPAFATFVKQSFAHRRKTLPNNLTAVGYERALVEAALVDIGQGIQVRPEAIPAPQFLQLFEAIAS